MAANPILLDSLLALALLGCALYVAYQTATLVPRHALTLTLAFLPLGFRRRAPIPVFCVTGLALLANLSFGFSDTFFETFAILLAGYTAVVEADWGPLLALTVVVWVIGLHLAIAIDWHNKGRINLADLPYNWLLLALPVVLGYGVRTRRAYTAQLEERNRLLGREAAQEERSRMARELHDVVAHSVSVMVLQASAGARLSRRDPAEAAKAFGVIEATGRQAMAELRRALGVLRGSEPDEALLPQPSLEHLDNLVDQVRRAGLAVEVHVSGQHRELASGVELSVYRIVQEALTNVLKHANATRADVRLSYAEGEVVLEVVDDGRDGSGNTTSGGQGLSGMRERARVFGGDLEAGPVKGGYRVRARLPLHLSPP